MELAPKTLVQVGQVLLVYLESEAFEEVLAVVTQLRMDLFQDGWAGLTTINIATWREEEIVASATVGDEPRFRRLICLAEFSNGLVPSLNQRESALGLFEKLLPGP